MYYDAVHAPQNLDIVLLGDSIIERWNGTRHMGTHPMEGMREIFESKFTRKGGGTLEGLALGSSGDTVSMHIYWDRIHDAVSYCFKHGFFLGP
jgi:lysophospholipase L1-like esterase